jgi:hypothetical protein
MLNLYLKKEFKKLKKKTILKEKFEKGYVPWIRWESENASNGKCIRYLGYFPRFFPLYLNSDHAVHSESKVWPIDLETGELPYFTWNFRKYLKLKKLGIKAYHVYNPWSFYVKKKKSIKKEKKQGTIVFFPHSNATTCPVIAIDKYAKILLNLPKKYHPFTIMLSQHDVNFTIYKKLSKYFANIDTAGSLNSQFFIDRFIQIIDKHRYATAPSSPNLIGSAFFYSIDFGIPFFFLHKNTWKVHTPSINIGKRGRAGNIKINDYLDEVDKKNLVIINKKFHYKNFLKIKNPKKIISKYMGYNSKISRLKISYILYKSFIFNLHRFIILYLKILFKYS